MQWELSVLHWFQSLHGNPVADTLMALITNLGEFGAFWIILTLIFLITKRYRKCGIAMAIALILSLIVSNGILKPLIQRGRPFWEDPSLLPFLPYFLEPTDLSFPSGHSSASFAAAVALFCYKKKEGTAAIVVAALIALSRLYLTVHFPTDVLAGTILGIAYGIGGYLLSRLIIQTWERKKAAKQQTGTIE